MNAPLGIIGGSGLARLATLADPRETAVTTRWGPPSAPLFRGRLGRREVVFLARHGVGHTLAPHRIDYRANVQALADAGVRDVIAIVTVGGIAAGLEPGALVVPHQLLDYTTGRVSSFCDAAGAPVLHVDFTHPYTPALRAGLVAAASAIGVSLVGDGVYACTQGPRLETAAEIDRLERDGATIVGMTGMPEAVLAREAGLGYATLAVVVNAAAGRGESAAGIAVDALQAGLDRALADAVRVLGTFCERDDARP
jgi:5'-methylthioinosine phosphorylase